MGDLVQDLQKCNENDCMFDESYKECSKAKDDCMAKAMMGNIGKLQNDGFDLSQINKKAYWAEFCPTLGSLETEEDAKKFCTVTPAAKVFDIDAIVLAASATMAYERETCDFGAKDPSTGDEWSCSIPEVRVACCDLVQDLQKCNENDCMFDESYKECSKAKDDCMAKAMMGNIGKLQNDGFDLSQINKKAYWAEFCPTLGSLETEEDAKKFCTVTPAAKVFDIDAIVLAGNHIAAKSNFNIGAAGLMGGC